MGVLKAKVGGVWVPIGQGFIASAPGLVGWANGTDQSGIGASMTDLTGLSVTFVADPTRTYKTTVIFTCYPSVGPATVVAQLANGAGALIKRSFTTISTLNYYAPISIVAVESNLSGTQTRKVQANTSAGTLTIYSAATAALIVVEDITANMPGGVGAPRGLLVMAAMTVASQTIPGTSTFTDLTGVTVTWTADPTRRYKTTLEIGAVDQSGAAATHAASITDGAGAQKRNGSMAAAIAGRTAFHVSVYENGLSGPQTRKGQFYSTAATTSVLGTTNNQYVPYISVEDIGV